MRLHAVLLGLFAIALPMTAWGQGPERPRVAHMLCNNFPPQKIEAPTDGLEGYDVDILRIAFAQVGVDVWIDYYPWARALHLASQGEADGLCSCSHQPERDALFYFSIPMGEVAIGIFSNAAGPVARSLDELAEKRVAVIRRYALNNDLSGRAIEIETVDSEAQTIAMLQAGRVDHVYAYRDPVIYAIQQSGRLQVPHFVLTTVSPYFACFSKRSPRGEALHRLFNQGLAEIQRLGADRGLRRLYVD